VENRSDSSRRLLYLLLGFASVFVIIWGIRASAAIINPILLALVITITVAPLPGKLKQRGMPGWLLGGIGAILSVPLTLIILDLLEGFSSTQWMVALARYMPGANPAEQRSAQEQFKQGWERIKALWSG
jgi:predicted PurR-regulated permease PerM